MLAEFLAGMLTFAVLATPAAQQRPDPLNIRMHSDLPYGKDDDTRQTLDVYAPADADKAPVVMFVHGGALLFGDKRLAAHVGVRLAAAGIVTVVPNHRFSPQVAHPEHVRDIAAATRWIHDQIDAFGGNQDHLIAAGHSSGGYLVGLLGTDERWLNEQDLELDVLAGVAPISGFFHVERLAPDRPKTVWGEQSDAWPQASAASYITDQTPPMLLVYAEDDDTARRAENHDFAAALQASDLAVTTLEAPGRDHHTIFYLLNLPGDETMTALVDFVQHRTQP